MRANVLSLLFALLISMSAVAGESGLNVIVVANQGSANSLQLANDYCELRGVPPQNVLYITNWTGGAVNFSPVQFTNFLLNPLLNMVATRSLTNQAEVVLLSMDIPYRVTDNNNVNSTTAALFYGFKINGQAVAGLPSCSLPDNSSNSYCYSEMPFRLAPPNTAATNSFLAMMLTDTNLAAAERTLRRGVASDSTFPTNAVCLEDTSDTARNVRFLAADNAVFENHVIGNYAVSRIFSDSTTFTNLLGFQTGLQNFTLPTNALSPGSIADNLTSFGGYILDPTSQTTLLAFLQAGATASFGTVVEPCNYQQKFPDPVDCFYQARGFSLAETYYQAVLNPFQGLMVGEPLSAPFARPGTSVWNSPGSGAGLAGTAPLSATFTSATTNLPLAGADLYVDGTFFQTVTNLLPVPGTVLTATVNGLPISYTVQTGDTLATAARGLAAALNQQTNATQVAAYPVGDRIELLSQAVFVPGSNVTLNATSTMAASTQLATPRPAFLDTVATGYHYSYLQNAPNVGDWMLLTVMKTNGVFVTVGVTNTVAGTALPGLLSSLATQINTNPLLTTPDGLVVQDIIWDSSSAVEFFLYARTPGPGAATITATLTMSTNLWQYQPGTWPLADNLGDLLPKDHMYLTAGTNLLNVTYNLDTTRLADGWHQLDLVAREGTSVQTQTRASQTVQIQNTGLAATFTSLPLGNLAAITQPLQFTVTANVTNIARIELFSTGGSVAVATNTSSANIFLAATNLGLGLHPFYALVTDTTGKQYRTPTVSYRLVPAVILSFTRIPLVLAWPAAVGSQYLLQYSTNLSAGFHLAATITATNSTVQYPVPTADAAGFYRVQVAP